MKRTLTQKLGLLGVVSFLPYTTAVVFASLAYHGYNWMSQAVSDLSAANAPSLALWNQLSAFYNVCEVVCITVVCIGMTFRNFYYLKQELVEFCRENALPDSGGKIELTDRIACFLDTGKVLPSRAAGKKATGKAIQITDDTIIEENLTCSETHRVFFIQRIGKGFSFNVPFQKWLKANAGKTYREAVEAYHRILEEKKNGKTEIAAQFEYNTYIRDFFTENHGRSLEDAIACWKYKKSLLGHNRYEQSDLIALD